MVDLGGDAEKEKAKRLVRGGVSFCRSIIILFTFTSFCPNYFNILIPLNIATY